MGDSCWQKCIYNHVSSLSSDKRADLHFIAGCQLWATFATTTPSNWLSSWSGLDQILKILRYSLAPICASSSLASVFSETIAINMRLGVKARKSWLNSQAEDGAKKQREESGRQSRAGGPHMRTATSSLQEKRGSCPRPRWGPQPLCARAGGPIHILMDIMSSYSWDTAIKEVKVPQQRHLRLLALLSLHKTSVWNEGTAGNNDF